MVYMTYCAAIPTTVTAKNEKEQIMVATLVGSSLLPENNTYCGRRCTASKNREEM